MSAAIAILITVLIALALSRLFGRPLNETFAFAIFGIILLVYLFGLLGALRFSRIFIACLGIASIPLFLFYRRSGRSVGDGFAALVKPDVLIVACGAILIGLFAVGRKVTDMDSFEQWAYVVKKMTLTGSLHSAQGQYASTALYPPGVALLQYYIGSFSRAFSEDTLFIGKNLLSFALLLPLFGQIRERSRKELLLVVPIVIFLPFTEYAAFDSALEVDPMLGLLFGYLILYGTDERRNDLFSNANLALGSFVLALTKTTGALFCGLAALIILFLRLASSSIRRQASETVLTVKQKLLPAVWIAAFAAMAAGSWILFVRSSGADIAQTMNPFQHGGLAQYQKETIVNFLNAVFVSEGGEGLNILSPILWIFLVPFLSAILINMLSQNTALRKRAVFGAALLSAGYLAWMLFLLIGYLTSFVEGEAMELAAFSRYLSSYQLGALFVFSAWLLEAVREKQARWRHIFLALYICVLAAATPFQSVFNATVGAPYANGKTADWRVQYEPSSRYYENLDVHSAKICYLDQNGSEPGYSFALFQFEALPYDVQKAIAWRFGGPYYKEDYYSQTPTAEEWETALLEGGFTHLYLRNTNGYFLGRYGTLFDNPDDIRADAYYRIDRVDGHVKFALIGA